MSAKSRTSAAKRALREELTVTVEDAAVLLGMNRKSAYAAVKGNQIPHLRIGRSIRIPSAALRSLLKVDMTNARKANPRPRKCGPGAFCLGRAG